jgi:putative heme-binding domain-containing protein
LRIVLRGLQIRGKPTPEPQRVWALQLIKKLLQASEPEHKLEGIRLAQQIKSVEVYEQVAKLMNQKSQTMPVRLAALRAANVIDSPRSIAMLSVLLAEKKQPKRLRAVAANLLAQNSQLETARNVLLKQLAQSAEPLKLPIAIALSSSSHGASALLDTIEQGSAPADLLQNATVSALLLRSGFSKKEEIDRRIRSIKGETQTTNTSRETHDTAPLRKLPSAETRQRIEKLVAGYKSASPEVARGKEVFTKNCANCHRIREEGNKVGPQLDGIGLRGIHKILEDLVDPNLNVDPNFQMSLVVLTTGKVVTGLSRGTQDQELLLIDSLGKEIRILEEEIEEINKLEVSPMPANFVEVLPENDLYDLLAFLITQKQAQKE